MASIIKNEENVIYNIQTDLSQKADVSYVNSENNLIDSSLNSITNELALKADTSYVDDKTNNIYIDNGNIGIGEEAPTAKLHIYNTKAISNNYESLDWTDRYTDTNCLIKSSGDNARLTISNSTNRNGSTMIDFDTRLSEQWNSNTIPDNPAHYETPYAAGRIEVKGTENSNYEQAAMIFHTCYGLNLGPGGGGTLTEKMRLTSDGKLGIGRSNPKEALDVGGTIRVHGSMGQFMGSGDDDDMLNRQEYLQFTNLSGTDGARFYSELFTTAGGTSTSRLVLGMADDLDEAFRIRGQKWDFGATRDVVEFRMTGETDHFNNRIVNVADPSNNQDCVNKQYVDTLNQVTHNTAIDLSDNNSYTFEVNQAVGNNAKLLISNNTTSNVGATMIDFNTRLADDAIGADGVYLPAAGRIEVKGVMENQREDAEMNFYVSGDTYQDTAGRTGILNKVMTLTKDGKLGVGTDKPDGALSVVGGTVYTPAVEGIHFGKDITNYQVMEMSSTYGGYIDFAAPGLGHKGRIQYIMPQEGIEEKMIFNSGGNTRMTILSDGKVGIGTDAPTSALSVVGTRDNTPSIQGIHMGEMGTNDYAVEICAKNNTRASYIDFTYEGQDYRGRIAYKHADNRFEIHTNGNSQHIDINADRRISNVTDPSLNQDVATKNYVDTEIQNSVVSGGGMLATRGTVNGTTITSTGISSTEVTLLSVSVPILGTGSFSCNIKFPYFSTSNTNARVSYGVRYKQNNLASWNGVDTEWLEEKNDVNSYRPMTTVHCTNMFGSTTSINFEVRVKTRVYTTDITTSNLEVEYFNQTYTS